MQEKIFTGGVLVITALLCFGMPKISNALKPESPFTQAFAVGIVEEVLEEDLSPDPVVQGRYRKNSVLKSLRGNIKIQNLRCIIRSVVYTVILRIRA